ncbi:MAG: response regulator transcription factor [Elusimicrobia bacterium]|nr:response regulator transcription factor [Elusimicrobiota bacterium]
MSGETNPVSRVAPSSKEILIVDDDEAMLNLLKILVQRDGFRIDLAMTGDDALEKLKRTKDALILDLMLPGTTSGFDVLKRLREFKGKIPPVIVVTAHAQSHEVKQVTADPNVVLFMTKPISQKKLLAALHKVLNTVNPYPETDNS